MREEIEWIPVTDWEPVSGRYLVTLEALQDKSLSVYEAFKAGDEGWSLGPVIAWAFLPKGYNTNPVR